MRLAEIATMVLILTSLALTSDAADFSVQVPMERADSGNYYVEGRFAGTVSARFLVDTGAGMSVIDRQLLRRLQALGTVAEAGRIAARLANGAVEVVDVYRLEGLQLGRGCTLGPLEVAVMASGGNILGLNALQQLAPFAMHLAPPKLALSRCGPGEVVALN